MIQGDCIDILKGLPEKSVKLLHFDPPYAGYRSDAEGGGYLSREGYQQGLRFDCANATTLQAMRLVRQVLRHGLRCLKDGGCMVLWGAGGRPDNSYIIQKARQYGWAIPHAGYWRKARPAARRSG